MSFANSVNKPDAESLVIISDYKPPLDFATAIAGKKFKRLHVYGKPRNLQLLATLTHLVELRMQSTGIKDFSLLNGMTKLEDLTYTGSLTGIDLSFAARSLTRLWLIRPRALTDVSPIEVCKKLKSLTLMDIPHLENPCDLAALPRLEFLQLHNVHRWDSLTGLAKATRLQKLLLDKTKIEDCVWEPLLKLKRLTYASGLADAFGKEAAAAFRGQRPEVETPKRYVY